MKTAAAAVALLALVLVSGASAEVNTANEEVVRFQWYGVTWVRGLLKHSFGKFPKEPIVLLKSSTSLIVEMSRY